MANVSDVKNKVVKITLKDGVEREVRFTLNALAELEDKYGTVEAAFEALDKGSIKAVRFILWAGLIDDDPELTEMQVGSLIDTQYMQELMGTLGNAFSADMPNVDEESNTDPN